MSTNAQQFTSQSLPTTAQAVGQPTGGQAEYMPGLTYNVGPALMSLLKVFADISNICQELVTSFTKSSMKGIDGLNDFYHRLGEAQQSESWATGISSIVSGVPTSIMGAYSLTGGSDTELTQIGEEEQGVQSYKSMIDEEVTKGPNANVDEQEQLGQDQKDEIDHQVSKLKDKTDFRGEEPTQEEKDAVKNSTYKRKVELQNEYRKKLEGIMSRKQARMSAISNRNNMLVQTSSALGQVSTGSGNIAAGDYRLKQQEEQSKVAATDAVLKGVLENGSSHFRSQVDKMLDEALQAVSALNSISNANKANG
ncbi:MAG: hypothetical protein KDK96_04880 [Chlamydiia bacterium]|nr:hypothetical protein [Chlamydiia bacterium]